MRCNVITVSHWTLLFLISGDVLAHDEFHGESHELECGVLRHALDRGVLADGRAPCVHEGSRDVPCHALGGVLADDRARVPCSLN